ncbi:hypothetical protein OIU84_005587 [Salix udensis]|uniref:Uncharacterized protein n=1 Tax=Salix udensis TaxID=889485 RepID=A0AAD6JWK2_9ROSI|nr:hypothetical protein OIU84_005587 [Salix udensis]
MECGNAQLGEIFNKNNFRCKSWDGHVQFRVVHGSSASDNCLRQEKGINGDGNPFHLWTNRNVDSFGSCWNERSAAPSSHSAALSQGIVPVFAREYGLHPDIMSTGTYTPNDRLGIRIRDIFLTEREVVLSDRFTL